MHKTTLRWERNNYADGFPSGSALRSLLRHHLMIGALAGGWLASVEARRRGYDPEIVWDGLIWVLIGGILGSRIWHILTPPNPWSIKASRRDGI